MSKFSIHFEHTMILKLAYLQLRLGITLAAPRKGKFDSLDEHRNTSKNGNPITLKTKTTKLMCLQLLKYCDVQGLTFRIRKYILIGLIKKNLALVRIYTF